MFHSTSEIYGTFPLELKKLYYDINLTNLNNNGRFWKTVKPVLSDKGSYTSKINLVNNDSEILMSQ